MITADRPGSAALAHLARPARQRLALHATDLLRRLVRGDHPDQWREPVFAGDVALARRHLEPIRDRRSLASSYARDAAVGIMPTGRPLRTATGLMRVDQHDAVSMAYAIRWLELGDGLPRPPWPVLIDHATAPRLHEPLAS